jgi:glycine/D-amino acid oxidase-like deaminating enzyme
MNSKEYEFVIVGGGVFGLSIGIYLAIHYPKAKFALLEQFKLGHGEGSSHSEIRIIRSTYQKAFYRDLCVEGINVYWPEVEKLLGQSFIAANSCLYYDEDMDSFKNFEQVAKTSKGQIEMLPVERIRELFPSAPYIETKNPVFHDTKAGVVFAQRYIKAMINFLKSYANATIFEDSSVTSVHNNDKGVKIIAKNK